MATVYRTKNKKTGEYHPHWRFAFKDYEGVRRVGTGTRDEEDTRKLAQAIETEHREIALGLKPPPKPKSKPRAVSPVVDEYLEWGALKGGKRGRPWNPTHLRNKRSRLTFWTEALELKSLADAQGVLPRVEKVLRELDEERSPKTVLEYADALVSFFAWCVKRDYLLQNPLRHLERGDTTPKTTRRALTPEEVERLLKAAPPERRTVYLLALVTGLRKNELAHLAPKHLDYANRQRIRGERGKRLMRRRGEILERSFAHCYETGGMRRCHLRSQDNILKRLLIHAGAFNLSLVLRRNMGVGTPRQLANALAAASLAAMSALSPFCSRAISNQTISAPRLHGDTIRIWLVIPNLSVHHTGALSTGC